MEIRQTKILGFTLLLAGLALCGTGLWLLLSPAQYQATARIKVLSEVNDVIGLGGPARNPSVFDPSFARIICEDIKSEVVFSNVVNALNLNTEWSEKNVGGGQLKTVDTIKLLRHRVVAYAVPNTLYLIEIHATSKDPDEAANIANAIAKAYLAFRIEQRRQLILRGIEVLQQRYQEEEKQIPMVQTNLDLLREKFKIKDEDDREFDSTVTLSEDAFSRYTKKYKESEAQFRQLQALSKDKLREVLPTVTSDSILCNLLDELHGAEQKYTLANNGHTTTSNPAIMHLSEQIDGLNKQIDQRVGDIMVALDNDLKTKKALLDDPKAFVAEFQKQTTKEYERTKPYWEMKRKLMTMIEFHKLLKIKIEFEQKDLVRPDNPRFSSEVKIVDLAIPPQTPESSNRLLGAILFAMGLAITAGEFFLTRFSCHQSA
jgi:uncharacterized protein involved in exopolysaccharide biosynthesis